MPDIIKFLKNKSMELYKETLLLHKRAPSTRIASALSTIDLFSVLAYGGFFDITNKKDRFIISKAHGCFSLYPILAEKGIISKNDLEQIGREGALLGTIPDCNVPGIINNGGALANGLGIACGMALAMKLKGKPDNICVFQGDGECNEGSVWEAVIFAAFHKLDNLLLIIDDNKMSMLGRQKEILGLDPLSEKFRVFGWNSYDVDGHNVNELYPMLEKIVQERLNKPKVLVASTVKGKRISSLENNCLCHIISMSSEEIDNALAEIGDSL